MLEPYPEPLRLTTLAEYQKLAELGFYEGEHVELLYGHVVELADMSPQGRTHASLSRRLATWLARRTGEAYEVQSHTPLELWADSCPEPDVVVVPATWETHEALLIIEVSETSLRNDRGIKARLYAEAGIPTYWIVDRPHDVVHVLSEPVDGRYQRIEEVRRGGELACAALPGLVVTVDDLFAV